MKKTFYIYAHKRLDKNEIFYIGKGKGRRANSKSDRNRYWRNIVKKAGYEVVFLETDLSEENAFELEKFYISKHNPVANLTKGGEGISGYKYKGELLYKQRKQVKFHMRRKDVREKLSNIKKEYYKDPNNIEKNRLAKLNSIKKDPSQVERQRNSLLKYYEDPQNRHKNSKANGGKHFVAIDQYNCVVWSGISQGVCADFLGVAQPNINKCLKKIRKTTGGFRFRYTENV